MQNLGLWGEVSHLLQKQHETLFLVVRSYKMWVSAGGYIYIYIFICTGNCTIAIAGRSPTPAGAHRCSRLGTVRNDYNAAKFEAPALPLTSR